MTQAMDKSAPQVSWGRWLQTKFGFALTPEQATDKLMQLFAKMVTEKRDNPDTFDAQIFIPDVKKLLDQGANPNEVFGIESVYDLYNYSAAPTSRITRGAGLTFLQWAEKLQSLQLIELLLSRGVMLDTTQQNKFLKIALEKNNSNLLQILLKKGTDPNTVYDEELKLSILGFALSRKLFTIARILLEYGADANEILYSGSSLLIMATMGKNTEAVRLLLEYGANPNYQGINNFTALNTIALNAHDDKAEIIVRLLLEHGADPNIKNNREENALDTALRYHANDNILELLRNPPPIRKRGLQKLP